MLIKGTFSCISMICPKGPISRPRVKVAVEFVRLYGLLFCPYLMWSTYNSLFFLVLLVYLNLDFAACVRAVGDNSPWWRHEMETFSALLATCAGNSPVPGEFPAQRPVTQSFDVFFDLHLNKQLSKQSWGWWFETLSCPLWCHCNASLVFPSMASETHPYYSVVPL